MLLNDDAKVELRLYWGETEAKRVYPVATLLFCHNSTNAWELLHTMVNPLGPARFMDMARMFLHASYTYDNTPPNGDWRKGFTSPQLAERVMARMQEMMQRLYDNMFNEQPATANMWEVPMRVEMELFVTGHGSGEVRVWEHTRKLRSEVRVLPHAANGNKAA